MSISKYFYMTTNYGVTYRYTAQQVAEDYASTAFQWQDEDDRPATKEELYQKIICDEDFLSEWFYDCMSGDIPMAEDIAERVGVDKEVYDYFIKYVIRAHGYAV